MNTYYAAAMLIVRVIAIVFVVVPVFYFAGLLSLGFIPNPEQNYWIALIVAFACSVGAGWYVWLNFKPGRLGPFSSTILGGIIFGGVAFAVGFFGPIIFYPEANQGPLLGFLFGPMGFIGGGIAGFMYWLIRSPKVRCSAGLEEELTQE